MDKLRIGIMGLERGLTFLKVINSLNEMAVVTAVCETDEKRIESAKKIAKPETVFYTDFDEFIDSGMDALILCNYFHEHSKYAIIAMKRGIHILSETTAAPTLGDCVELCRTVEQTKCKYMLAANSSYTGPLLKIKKLYEEGTLGEAIFCEAEYLHPGVKVQQYQNSKLHWRQTLPGTYYNMHTLGPLMFVTNSMPKTVIGKAVRNKTVSRKTNRLSNDVSAITLCEMDNGATFSSTGWCNYGPASKWYRFSCTNGSAETQRFDQTKMLFAENKPGSREILTSMPTWLETGIVSEEELANYTPEQIAIGHNGMDFWLTLSFIKYLKGEYIPFFDVYRAVAISAVAILGWKSVLENGKEFAIPDFRNESERKIYENNYDSPFDTEHGKANIFFSSEPLCVDFPVGDEAMKAIRYLNSL